MREFHCPECGLGTVKTLAVAGRTTRYKQIEIEVPADLEIPTCDNCGEEYMHGGTAKAMDAAFEPVYRETIKAKLIAAFIALEPLGSMRRIEMAFGLSEGYLSKVKQGRGEASPALVSSLVLLASSPQSLESLEAMWSARVRTPKPRAKKGGIPIPVGSVARTGGTSKRPIGQLLVKALRHKKKGVSVKRLHPKEA